MEIPAVALFFQRLIQNRQAATQKRMMDSMSAMADERYYDFLKTYPLLSQRLPQHMIAAYLGITPESLSRIRKNLGKKADK
jgi:CRP-like cAMP-binding protein